MRKQGLLMLAAAGAIALSSASPVAAQNTVAYNTSFFTSITYQNVGTGTANLSLDLYGEGAGTAIPVTINALPANAGTSLNMQSVSAISSGFKGAGILSSDEPIVATMVQIPSGTRVVNRPLSNGFGPDEGAATFRIPTILKNTFGFTTVFSVQNIDSVGADLAIQFINAEGAAAGTVAHTINVTNLPVGSVRYVDVGTVTELPAGFNGSLTVTAKKTGTQTDGRIVATALELSTGGIDASAFEGSAAGGTKLYMPSALCNAFGINATSAYAVQSLVATGGNDLGVKVTYKTSTTGAAPFATFEQTKTIKPGAKASFNACEVVPANQSGSAVVEVTSGTGQILGVLKVFNGGISSSTPGATVGAAKLALPYVRWTELYFQNPAPAAQGGVRRQRTNIAIQNVGPAITAGQATVKYYNAAGQQVGTTHSLPALGNGDKTNSNPFTNAGQSEFGVTVSGTGVVFGGSAVIECTAPGCQLVAVARVSSFNAATRQLAGEDYNGIPVQ